MDSLSSFDNSPNARTQLFVHRKASWLLPLERAVERLSPGERLIAYVLAVVLAVSALALLAGANNAVSVTVPSRGGELVEGVVGPARFINPLLALSGPDSDLTALV